MSSSNIVFKIEYKKVSNKKKGIKSWMNYVSKKEKADSSSIDEYNLLKDYALFTDKETYLDESYDTYLWSSKGDVLKNDELNKLQDNNKGLFWNLINYKIIIKDYFGEVFFLFHQSLQLNMD